MDVFAHALWTTAGAKAVNKKKKILKVGWAAFWGVVPDFFAFTIPFLILFWNVIRGNTSFSHHAMDNAGTNLAPTLYQYSHSLIIWAAVFILVWIIFRKPRLELLGWALHILIDIPSHTIHFYPTPFLFPLSEYRFPYGVSWADPTFMIINYSLLLLVCLYMFNERRKRRKYLKSV